MDQRLTPLFTPWKIRDVEMKNRIVLTSMGGTSLFGWMEINHFDKEAAKFILERAQNEVGLILPGIQPVYNPMLGQWLYRKKGMYKKLKEFMKEVHKTGAKLFVQLTAGFGRSFAISPMLEKLATTPVINVLSKPIMNISKICASASESPNVWSDKVPSRALTLKEIHHFVLAFAKTAKLLKEADVDGVEIHAVHEGYLLDQFTLPYVNKRTDEYGGSFENRYRFPVEIVQAIKKVCGEDFPVSLRFSVVSKTKGFRKGALPGEEYKEVGRDIEEARKAAKYLQDAGYDMLNCDNGTYDAWYWAHPPVYMPDNCNLEYVEDIRKYVDIPVVCAGKMSPYDGAEAVKEGKIDAVGFARSFLADGAWVKKIKEGHEEEIRPCIYCHNGCFNLTRWKGSANMQSLSDTLHMARCAVNPETMQTNKHYIKKAKTPKRVAIIGGGIGGMEAARVLALRGHKPEIFEKSDHLGGVFVEGSKASFKEPLRKLLKWYINQMNELGVRVHLRKEIKDLDDIPADSYIIATGSTPKHLPIKGSEKVIEAIDYLKNAPKGEKLLVIGGGLTGCEIAYEAFLEGRKPMIVEMQDDLIKQVGVCMANSMYLREYFELHKIPVFLESRVVEVKEHSVIMEGKDGKQQEVPVDLVVSSTGYNPHPLSKAHGKRIQVIGDCLKVGNVRTVTWSAYEAAMKI